MFDVDRSIERHRGEQRLFVAVPRGIQNEVLAHPSGSACAPVYAMNWVPGALANYSYIYLGVHTGIAERIRRYGEPRMPRGIHPVPDTDDAQTLRTIVRKSLAGCRAELTDQNS